MIYISASTIKDYISCPKKVEFRINKTGESVQTPEQLAGTIVHHVIETCWDSIDKAYKELDSQYRMYPDLKLKSRITTCVDNFYKMYPPGVLGKDDQVEKYFKIPFNSEITLTGKIDRIHNHVVYDWKTGASAPEDMDRDPQFIIYYLAYQKLYKRDPAAMTYVSLATKKNYLFHPVKDYVDELQQETIPYIAKQIKQGKFPRLGLFGYRVCTNCAFQDPCWRGLAYE